MLAVLCGTSCQRPSILTKLPWNQRCCRRSAVALLATKTTSSMGVNSVLWFRKGLRYSIRCKFFTCQSLFLTTTTKHDSLVLPTCRLHDNPALHAALKDCDKLYPVFCLDPW